MIQIKMGKAVDTDRMRLIAKDTSSNKTLFMDEDSLYIYNHECGKRTLSGPFTPKGTLKYLADWTLLPGMVIALERAGVLIPEKKEYSVYIGVEAIEVRVKARDKKEAQNKAVKLFREKYANIDDGNLYYGVDRTTEIKSGE